MFADQGAFYSTPNQMYLFGNKYTSFCALGLLVLPMFIFEFYPSPHPEIVPISL